MIAVNARFRRQIRNGQQRYAAELAERMPGFGAVREIGPSRSSSGLAGHAWEQLALPRRLDGELLWSPCNTGPVHYAAQVVTLHDLAVIDHPEWFSRRFGVLYRWLMPRLLANVRRIITVSNFSRSRIGSHFGSLRNGVEVVYPGISSAFARPVGAVVNHLCSRLGLERERYLLCVASLEPRKNHARLLAAWALARAGLGAGFRLVLAGSEGDSRVFRNNSIHQDQSVLVLGRTAEQDLPALYAGAAAFIYPSLYEGFGFPCLEAMACGAPVIAGNRASLPEVLGTAAAFCDPEDVRSIATAITRVCSDKALRAELAGRGEAQAGRYRWETASKTTWQILTSCA